MNDIEKDSVSGVCLLCGCSESEDTVVAHDYLTNVKGAFTYIKCTQCGSYSQTPTPTQEFLNKCYANQKLGYHSPVNNRKKDSRLTKLSQLCESHILRLLSKFSSFMNTIKLTPSLPAPAKVLEIGCSYGLRLAKLKEKGYDVTGVELSAESVTIAKEKYGLEVINSTIEECHFKDEEFDIIILSMVLEHLTEPKSAINEIKTWLKLGGELLLSLPSADGFEFKIFKEYCYVVQPPYHIFLPTELGIKKILGNSFDIIDIRYDYFHRDLVSSAQFKSNAKSSLFAKIISTVGNYKTVQPLLRVALATYTLLGGKTSRVSVRCKRI